MMLRELLLELLWAAWLSCWIAGRTSSMAIYALTSASGAPGVTTTALGLALAWPHEVMLVDADPVGGSAVLAGYFNGTVAHPGTLVEMWAAHRQGWLQRALREMPLRIAEHVSFIPGPAGAAQASSLTDLWPALAQHLQDLSRMDVDVLVDLGRLGHQHFAAPLAHAADELLILMRSDLVSVAAAAAAQPPEGVTVRVILVGEKRPYTAGEVAAVVKRPVAVSLPWEPDEAAVLSHGTASKKSSGYRRALRQTAEALNWRGSPVLTGVGRE